MVLPVDFYAQLLILDLAFLSFFYASSFQFVLHPFNRFDFRAHPLPFDVLLTFFIHPSIHLSLHSSIPTFFHSFIRPFIEFQSFIHLPIPSFINTYIIQLYICLFTSAFILIDHFVHWSILSSTHSIIYYFLSPLSVILFHSLNLSIMYSFTPSTYLSLSHPFNF